MPIYYGSSKQKTLYYGGTKIKEAYYGSTKVYSAGYPSGTVLLEKSANGTYSLKVTECNEEAVFGQMSGNADEYVLGLMASTLKGELSNGTGKTVMVDIYF